MLSVKNLGGDSRSSVVVCSSLLSTFSFSFLGHAENKTVVRTIFSILLLHTRATDLAITD